MIVPIGKRRLTTGARATPSQPSAKAVAGARFHVETTPATHATMRAAPTITPGSKGPVAGGGGRKEEAIDRGAGPTRATAQRARTLTAGRRPPRNGRRGSR